MRCLFYDTEFASSFGGISKICEFGYVVTDEKLNVIKKGNYIINPVLKSNEWNYRVVRDILTRPIKEYEKSKNFKHYYNSIKSLFEEADYVFGHSLVNDVKALNDDTMRYKLPSIDHLFYDLKIIYNSYENKVKDTSVVKILENLKLTKKGQTHDAEVDAYNVLISLKEILDTLDMSVEELTGLCPDAKDENKNYIIKSVEIYNTIKDEDFESELSNPEMFFKKRPRDKKKRFLQFLDNVKPTGKSDDKLKNRKISISINFEQEYSAKLFNIVQRIVNEGGEYILKASHADIFVTYDIYDDKNNLHRCTKYEYVKKANEKGKNIEIISFSDLLDILGLSEEKIDKHPMISFDFLLEDDAIVKDPKEKKKLDRIRKRIKES